jgi:translation initiation factor IF-2
MTETNHKKIVKRSPVICIMGHIDHGKSTLLDYIRKTNIVDTEAGGITQRISAYEVTRKDIKITFLDTPGHEAFSAMRESGVNVADIAILVVSAEDGVKKQTLEAYKCIIENKVPFIVAITKIDKPDANVEKVKNSLVENGIYIEGYGGDIPCVAVSAKTGQGIEELLDMMILVADLSDLKGDLSKNAEGAIIEANLDKQKGITATLVIKDGILKNGMFVVCGESMAPTRIMESFLGEKIKEAQFSSPIRLVGFDKLPEVGTSFYSFETKKEAENFVTDFISKKQKENKTSQENTGEEKNEIKVLIKAEVAGALSAIKHELAKIQSETVKIKIIATGIGGISENDVKSITGKGKNVIVGFDVKVDASAKDLAERAGIEIKVFDIIYKITEWLQEIVNANTPKVESEEIIAKVKVLKYFSAMKDKHIIGCRVEEGTLHSGDEVKIMRAEVEIGRAKVKEIQKDKSKVSEAKEGMEFGCQIQTDIVVAPGDKLEAFKIIIK